MVKQPSAKVYSKSVSVSYPGQSLKCVKVTTLGPRMLYVLLFVSYLILIVVKNLGHVLER